MSVNNRLSQAQKSKDQLISVEKIANIAKQIQQEVR